VTSDTLAAVFAQIGLEDGVGLDDFVTYAAGALTVLALFGVLFRKPMREIHEFLLWWRKFQRDWDGAPSEPGRSAVPGMPERMNRIDGELKRNGGSTVKDQVVKTAVAVEKMSGHLDNLQKQVNGMEDRQIAIEEKMARRREDHVPPEVV
jgi:hypothetical protein